MPQTAAMTINLPIKAMNRLDALARATAHPKDYLAARAIEEYLDLQEWQIQAIQEAVEEADSPDAKFLDHDEVEKRVKSMANV